MIGTELTINEGQGRQCRELTQEEYIWLLECVPPLEQRSNSFVNSEPYSLCSDWATNIYSCGFEFEGNIYRDVLMTRAEYKAIKYVQTLEEFEQYLSTLVSYEELAAKY